MKRLLLLLLLAVCCVAHTSGPMGDPGAFKKALMEFNQQYFFFTRDYLGCPYSDQSTVNCVASEGHINYAAYMKAAKLAKRVFPADEQ